MKKKSFSIYILAVAAFMILWLGISPLQASQYLGEVTWTGLDSDNNTFTVTAGISRMGGPYYEVQGQVPNAPGGGRVIFSGGGVMVGNDLMLTLTMTVANQYGNQVLGMRLRIDKTTFNGSFWLVQPVVYIPHGDEKLNSWSDPFPQGTYPQGYVLKSSLYDLGNPPTTGTLTVVGNPINLTPTTVPQSTLLLE